MQTTRDLGMDTVRVARDKLLNTLKLNREKHIKEFDESVVGYRKHLKEALEDKQSDLILAKTTDELLNINLHVNLDKPRSYDKDYSVAIDMLEWSVDDFVDLTQHDFKKYVLDEWQWKESFIKMSATYK